VQDPRENGGSENGRTLYAGELEIRPGEGLALATGQALRLSVREFELLVAMVRRIGAIVTREELYGTVWGAQLRPGDRSVDVYVSKLRTKLEAAMPDRRFIHTHPGFGYRFQPQPQPQPQLSPNVHTRAVDDQKTARGQQGFST
jgi:DNA-binding response OmpR family regulator